MSIFSGIFTAGRGSRRGSKSLFGGQGVISRNSIGKPARSVRIGGTPRVGSARSVEASKRMRDASGKFVGNG
jgi:hypothetical protein